MCTDDTTLRTAGSGEALRRERELLARLLELNQTTDLDQTVDQALALMVEMAAADQGYLEVEGGAGGAWAAHNASDGDVDAIRRFVSRGIVAAALAQGQTIETPAAVRDPRFKDRTSVQTGQLGAVLCVPIGDIGVLYLHTHGRTRLDPTVRTFAELFARHAGPPLARFLDRPGHEADPTRPFRARLIGHEGLVGRSRAMAEVLRQVTLVAPLDVTVLLTGASGTGKTELARLIASNCGGGPFVHLNCAALPDTLLESELFGASAGAHSTAARDVPGKVEAAEGGILFLDEVGELSVSAQAKLLQLIQDRVYYRLGDTKRRTADVRIVAATNVDLSARIADGRFREDLYYRLAVMPIRVPDLDERKEDITPLVRAIAARASARHGLEDKPWAHTALSMATFARWPGQIRQLANAVEAAVIRAAGDGATEVLPHHVFPEAAGRDSAERADLQEATREFQRHFVEATLKSTGWNVSEAARRLGLARSHVYNLIKALGLQRS